MSHVTCTSLAYAHPGGDLLFTDVSFHVAPGDHVGLVGANGVGKSTLFRVIAGELPVDEGEATVGGRLAYMPQDVGVGGDLRTVRELLTSLAPHALRTAGERMVAAERALAAGDEHAGMELGAAIGEWSGLGGYELEGQWDASCRRIVRSSFAEVADRPAVTLSGGERKRLVLDVLFASDAEILLLDEPDNFLDVPAKRELEKQIRSSRKTILLISHDRDLLASAVRSVLTLEGSGAWMHPGSYATSGSSRRAPAQARRRRQALEGGGAPALPPDEDLQGARSLRRRLGKEGRRRRDALEALRRSGAAAGAGGRPADQDADPRGRLRPPCTGCQEAWHQRSGQAVLG
jgi:ATPase subunit of ABC transporter with duplicated ATPase domains